MSPILFNIYTEAMIREALDEVEIGIKLGGQLIKSVRFADDQVTTASSQQELQHIMNCSIS